MILVRPNLVPCGSTIVMKGEHNRTTRPGGQIRGAGVRTKAQVSSTSSEQVGSGWPARRRGGMESDGAKSFSMFRFGVRAISHAEARKRITTSMRMFGQSACMQMGKNNNNTSA